MSTPKGPQGHHPNHPHGRPPHPPHGGWEQPQFDAGQQPSQYGQDFPQSGYGGQLPPQPYSEQGYGVYQPAPTPPGGYGRGISRRAGVVVGIVAAAISILVLIAVVTLVLVRG
ncbi:hypothetical protein GCM10028820_04820 [Tessaracoccus terricola]